MQKPKLKHGTNPNWLHLNTVSSYILQGGGQALWSADSVSRGLLSLSPGAFE